jgi:hypothetical protein
MKLSLILASALTALLPVLTATPDNDIAGIYECEGTTANGSPYKGTVEIARNNGTYEVLWTFGPREHYLGFGVVNENVLAVSVLAGMPGVVAYKIEKSDQGSRLLGQWTVPNSEGRVFTETLTKVGNAPDRPAKPATPAKPESGSGAPPRGKVRPSWLSLRAA